MKFINRGESIKIRKGERGNHTWFTLKKGETMDLPKSVGIRNKLETVNVTQSQAGPKVVETKQFEYTSDGLFLKELQKIKGIGKKTAEDIVSWGTKEKIIEQIKLKAKLPFRDDVEEKLRSKYA